ncbi:DNA-binding domain-containing protein [Rheinheimera hassiensis]|uniref:HvfC family RiPP maturation protein n=1 Tax=Rheinheimera hassiensis TaxID=1193627 RepID=UPI001F057682|nr:putative DNA-binding domain-containing protein [Rheinheimera hassiensis]
MQFQQIQQAFIAHIKDPEHQSAPVGIEDRRMAIYRELVFNNVEGFIASAFPVLKSLYKDADWQALVRQFFIQYQCSSPYFLHIAEHFLHYLQQDYVATVQDPAFMLELAHYEWAELYLATKQLPKPETLLTPEQVTLVPLYLSSLAMVLAYPYAVHQICADYQPDAAGEIQYYLLYRNAADDVKFVLINQLTAALLQTLQQSAGSTLATLVQQLLPLLPQLSAQQLMQGATALLQDFAAKGVLVSFQAEQNSLP